MAFLLRNISRSASGREIIRESRVDEDLLRVGRDPNSDIRLNDLAVALHHVTLELIGGGLLGVSAEAGLTIEIDGSAIAFGQIHLPQGGDIRVGPFLLRVMPVPAGTNDISIDIERADDDAVAEKIDVRRFALESVMPGKRIMAWTLVIVVLAVTLAWPIWSFYSGRNERDHYAQGYHADALWTAGPLSRAHAALEHNCQACHAQPFTPVRDVDCKACHTNIHDHADPRRLAEATPNLTGFRRLRMEIGAFFGQTTGRCVECHREHEGAQAMPPTPQQFCADCHTDLRARLHDTRLASASDFATGHPEFQPAVLIRWNGNQPDVERVSLGDHPHEMSNLKFPHALHLDPRGGVAQMGRTLHGRSGFGDSLVCSDCHVPTPDGTRFQPVNMEANCGMCHSLAFDNIGGTIRTLRHGAPAQVIADIRALFRSGGPQRPPELSAGARTVPGDVEQIRAAIQFASARNALGARSDQAIRAVFSQGGACFDCHEVIPPAPGTLNYGIRPVAFPTRYMLHGWFDHRQHQILQRPGQPRLEGNAACASCHNAPASNSSTDLLLPDLNSCRVCHGGEHTNRPVASTCAMCHDYHATGGAPAALLRRQTRGQGWQSTPVQVTDPQPTTAARRQ